MSVKTDFDLHLSRKKTHKEDLRKLWVSVIFHNPPCVYSLGQSDTIKPICWSPYLPSLDGITADTSSLKQAWLGSTKAMPP